MKAVTARIRGRTSAEGALVAKPAKHRINNVVAGFSPRLKRIFQRQLDNTRAHRGSRNLSGASAAQRHIGQRKLRMVKRIKKFRPELHRLIFSYTGRFGYRHIPIILTGPKKNATRRIAKQSSRITCSCDQRLRTKHALHLAVEVAGTAR